MASEPVTHPQPLLSFELPPSKVELPAIRPGVVERTGLLDRLGAEDARIIAVVAPAGYGKTTLLAQWARQRAPRVAWVSCDPGDNDPVVLLSALAVSLNRIERIDPAIFPALPASGSGITFVGRFVAAIARLAGPVAVVFDHTELVTNKECRAMIAEFAMRLPRGWQIAVASRTTSALPTARLRVAGGLVEVRADDLAMGDGEATALLTGAGVGTDPASTAQLRRLTEGWPAGLYLAALAIRAGAWTSDVRAALTGDDRYVGDYVRSEMLDHLTDDELRFLTRTCVVDTMCGPLCDALLGRADSARVLEDLEERNLLVVPLDRRREWYRYHHLLRELLDSALRRREPQLIPELHRRAAAWYEASGMPETAIMHAEQGGDFDRAVRLVLELAQPVWASGRGETVLAWMESLRDQSVTQHFGALAVHGALMFALAGKPGEAERWVTAAERVPADGVLPDGSTMAATLAYLRAILFRSGVEEMRRDAQLALAGLSPSSPYRATMLYTDGLAYLFQGAAERADAAFAHAYDFAVDSNALPLAALVLAERCIVAADREAAAEATTLSQRAVDIVDDRGLGEYWTSALVYAARARIVLRHGDTVKARGYLGRAARLRPLLTYALPAVSVQTLIEMARCYIALGDAGGAAAVLRQAQDIITQRPDLGTLPGAVDALREKLTLLKQANLGPTALTAAELRLLPLLSTHLSLREIAERQFLSLHTIKSHAHSIYQKLGVSSRSEAVSRTVEFGLVEM